MKSLFYMQYGFVALCLSFVWVKAAFIFPTSKEYQKSSLQIYLLRHGSTNQCLIAQNTYKLPTINYQSSVESSEIDPSPEAQIVRNRGHG